MGHGGGGLTRVRRGGAVCGHHHAQGRTIRDPGWALPSPQATLPWVTLPLAADRAARSGSAMRARWMYGTHTARYHSLPPPWGRTTPYPRPLCSCVSAYILPVPLPPLEEKESRGELFTTTRPRRLRALCSAQPA
jgi:hypothetical protein